MSNFMHKVKDAMTDRDKDTGRGFRAPHDNQGSSDAPATDYDLNQNRSSEMGSNNPYGSGRSGDGPTGYRDSNFNDTQGSADPTRTGMGNQGGRSGDYGSTGMGGDVNAGPHDSKLGNKMDPRVDSDMDNRAARGTGTMNPQRSSNAPGNQGLGVDSDMDNRAARGTGTMNPQRSSNAPGNQGLGVDNHETSEDDFKKSTQEKKSQFQPQPGEYGDNPLANEESRSTSTQEHKSHSATKHAMPCQTDLQNEPGLSNRAEPSFGGDAAGGSSYASGGREPSGAQNDDPMNKLDPRVTRSNQQANVANQRGQRGGY